MWLEFYFKPLFYPKDQNRTVSLTSSCTSLTMKIMSNRDRMVGMKSIFSAPFVSSQRPNTLLAAAKTEQREFSVVVMPACIEKVDWSITKPLIQESSKMIKTASRKINLSKVDYHNRSQYAVYLVNCILNRYLNNNKSNSPTAQCPLETTSKTFPISCQSFNHSKYMSTATRATY